MPQVFDWQQTANQEQFVRDAAEAIRSGQIVAFPTETVYGVAALASSPEAVERLVHCKGRPEDKPLALALADASDLRHWVPSLSKVARRLTRRCWPGPVTLVFAEGSDVTPLPPDVRQRVSPQKALGVRVPAHNAILNVLDQIGGPLVLTSANRSGEPDAVTGQQVVAALGEAVDVVIDDGPTRYGKPSSVIRIIGDRWEMLREGVVSPALLEQLTACVILFVCTGNTCRSPLAEALCKKLLAERLGCAVEVLPSRGYVVCSAGVSAIPGSPAAEEAVAVAQARGADLAAHASQPLTSQLLRQADFVFGMTQGHVQGAATLLIDDPPVLEVLSPDGTDLDDPIGGDRQVYEACAEQIEAALRTRLPMLIS